MHACIYCWGKLEGYYNGLMCNEQNVGVDWMGDWVVPLGLF